MRLEQFEYLMAIHETHSISLASQNLHVSQQNISKAIQNLENELETVLLQRSNHGTFLTAAGLIVLKHAQKIFYEISILVGFNQKWASIPRKRQIKRLYLLW